MKRQVSELFLVEIYFLFEQVTNLKKGVLDNILDDNDKKVPGPELGDVG